MFEFVNTLNKIVLRDLSKTLSSMLVVARIKVRRHLATLYIRGSEDAEEYGALSYTQELPEIIPQSHGEYLDRLGYMFDIDRNYREDDESYRQRIIFAIKISATKIGVKNTLKFIFSNSFLLPKYAVSGNKEYPIQYNIEIRETMYDFFDGANTALNSPMRGKLTHQHGMVIYITPMPYKKIYRDKITGNEDLRYIPKSPNYHRILEGQPFRDMMDTITAAGIKVDRVIFNQPGGSGNKGEFYDYKV